MLKLARIAFACFSFLPLLLLAAPLTASSNDIVAKTALQQGRVEDAAAALNILLASSGQHSFEHQLLCRVFYSQDMADPAIAECEASVREAPSDSDNQMWLGRVYGMKASQAGPITGLRLARRVREAFERAVQLNPANMAAANDLGEYYIAAPAIIGGGADKARRLASSIEARFPESAHRLRALTAEDQKDLATAEAEFKSAVAAGKHAEAYIDLAHFYQQHDRPDQAEAVLRIALATDRQHGPPTVDAASILTNAHRMPQLAQQALSDYLSSTAQTDAAPTFKVHLQLGRLLADRGDPAGARREYAAAFKLAPNFAPARKAALNT